MATKTKTAHAPKSLQEFRAQGSAVRNVNIERREQLTKLERAALFVTNHVGTMGFFLIIAAWSALWILWNSVAPLSLRFDPFPAFVLWLFMSNLVQIMLMPLLMVGQNLQGKHAEARAEADFEVNVRAEKEIEAILEHLENQSDLILGIVERLERMEKKPKGAS